MDLPSAIKQTQMLLKELRAWLGRILRLNGDQAFAAWSFCVAILIFADFNVLYLGQTPHWARAIIAAAGLGAFFIWWFDYGATARPYGANAKRNGHLQHVDRTGDGGISVSSIWPSR